jgi:hypothetical protein
MTERVPRVWFVEILGFWSTRWFRVVTILHVFRFSFCHIFCEPHGTVRNHSNAGYALSMLLNSTQYSLAAPGTFCTCVRHICQSSTPGRSGARPLQMSYVQHSLIAHDTGIRWPALALEKFPGRWPARRERAWTRCIGDSARVQTMCRLDPGAVYHGQV